MLPNEQFDANEWAKKLDRGDLDVEFGDIIHRLQTSRVESPKLTRGRRYAIWMRVWEESESQPLINMSTINYLTAAWAAMVVVIMIAVSLIIPSGFETEMADAPSIDGSGSSASTLETVLTVIPNIATIPLEVSSLEVTQVARSGSTSCIYSSTHWKNHSADWPVESLVLGSETYTQVEMMIILQDPAFGDVTNQLAQQLIAAEFNIVQMGDDLVAATFVTEAHQWLTENPAGSSLSAVDVQAASTLINELEAFNTSETLNGEGCSR